jgi:beta-lactamase regulating signal transducer with metallopeptidase domain
MLSTSMNDLSAAVVAHASLLLLLVKATIILVAAVGITMAMQRASAGARHLVWLVTLGTILLVPVLASWAPIRLRILPPVEAAAVAPDAAEAVTPAVSASPAVSSSTNYLRDTDGAVTRIKVAPFAKTPASAPSRVVAAVTSMSGLGILFAIWAVVVVAVLASLAWAGIAVRRIVRNATPLDADDWRTPLLEVADRMGLEELPLLLKSNEAKMPFACGMMQPTIVFPAECESWSLDRRHAVLLHELAHVRRHDLFGHTLGRLACAVYWFHPLVWTAAKQLRAESERACDDLALACGTKATDYAEHLLDIVTSVRGDSTPLVAMAMARRKEFEGRMLAILDPELRHSTPSRKQSMVLISSLALVALTVGAVAPAPREASAAQVAAAAPAPRLAPARDTTPSDSSEIAAALRAAADEKPDVTNDASPDANGFVMKEMHHDSMTGMHSASESMSESVSESVSRRTSARTSGSIPIALPAPAVSALASAGIRVGVNAATTALEMLGDVLDTKGGKGSKVAKNPDERGALLARILRSDSSATNRRVAAWGLRDYADEADAGVALVTAVKRDSDPRVREMAAWVLGEAGEHVSGATDALVAALRNDTNDRVRVTSAWSLGHIDESSSLDALVSALSDANADVRARAVWAIGQIQPKQAPAKLTSMLADKEPRVRTLASWALYTIEDPATVPALQRALNTEENKEVQIGMIRALAVMGERSVDALRSLLESKDERVKQMAVRALAGGHASGPWPWPWPEPRPQP